MLPVCVKRSRLYCSTIIFCNLIFKSASKLQLCLSSCLHGAWNACILWLKRDCSGQSHVIRQVVPPTLSIIKAIPPSSGTWYKVFTADRSFVWVTMLTYEEVFKKALDFLCMENNSNVVFFFHDHQQAFLIRSLVWAGLPFTMTWDAHWYLFWSLLKSLDLSGHEIISRKRRNTQYFSSVLNLVFFFCNHKILITGRGKVSSAHPQLTEIQDVRLSSCPVH